MRAYLCVCRYKTKRTFEIYTYTYTSESLMIDIGRLALLLGAFGISILRCGVGVTRIRIQRRNGSIAAWFYRCELNDQYQNKVSTLSPSIIGLVIKCLSLSKVA